MPFSMTRAFRCLCCGEADQEQYMDNSSSSDSPKEHRKNKHTSHKPPKDSGILRMGPLIGNSNLDIDAAPTVPKPGPFPSRTDLQMQQHKRLSRGLHTDDSTSPLSSSQNTALPGPPKIRLSPSQHAIPNRTTGSPRASASTTGKCSDLRVAAPPETPSQQLLLQATTTSTLTVTQNTTGNPTTTSTLVDKTPTILITPPVTSESPLAQSHRFRATNEPPAHVTSLPPTPPSSPSPPPYPTRPKLSPSIPYLTLPTACGSGAHQVHRSQASRVGKEWRQSLTANTYPPGTYIYNPWPTDQIGTTSTTTGTAVSPRDRYFATEGIALSSQEEDLVCTARPKSRPGFRDDDGGDDIRIIAPSSSSSAGPDTQARRFPLSHYMKTNAQQFKSYQPPSLRSRITVQRQLGEIKMEPINEVWDAEDEDEDEARELEGDKTEQRVVLKATICTMKRYAPRQVRQIHMPTCRRTAKPPMHILEPISEVE